jgi:hypothetical protein
MLGSSSIMMGSMLGSSSSMLGGSSMLLGQLQQQQQKQLASPLASPRPRGAPPLVLAAQQPLTDGHARQRAASAGPSSGPSWAARASGASIYIGQVGGPRWAASVRAQAHIRAHAIPSHQSTRNPITSEHTQSHTRANKYPFIKT